MASPGTTAAIEHAVRRTIILIVIGAVGVFTATAEPPVRSLIGVDKYGSPHVAAENKSAVARVAVAADTSQRLRYDAIRALALSGYSPESLEATFTILSDRAGDIEVRGVALMGLGNFTFDMPAVQKEKGRAMVRGIFKAEGAPFENLNTSSFWESAVRLLLAWDDAPWIATQMGESLAGNPLEVEVLARLPGTPSTTRLWSLYEQVAQMPSRDNYNQRAEIGRALIKLKDRRGMDILDTLLDAPSVPLLQDGTPNHQYRDNVFNVIRKTVGRNFGYESINYDPTIDEAIKVFRQWWPRERDEFQFPNGDLR